MTPFNTPFNLSNYFNYRQLELGLSVAWPRVCLERLGGEVRPEFVVGSSLCASLCSCCNGLAAATKTPVTENCFRFTIPAEAN